MKYVALLSGGKDSCYNLVHCHRNGHELVAAASLGPEQGKEELDSYLYQTVGQDAIELVARALDVPLFRRVISGTAVEQGSEYGRRDAADRGGTIGDETEDLYALLSDVKSQFPDVQGVSVGAILSSYQRVRVEHVCQRLSLTPLCYLWQRDQAELLDEMISAGMEAILIKVAGIGLTTKHLGKTLAQMQPTLTKLNTLYGSHICGEGGEYETLTLDCPLFKQRIILEETETVIHSDSDFATVAFLRIKGARLEPKPTSEDIDLIVPKLLEDEYDSVAQALHEIRGEDYVSSSSSLPDSASLAESHSRKIKTWVAIADIHRKLDSDGPPISLEDEVRECFHILRDRLAEHNLLLSHIANVNILLSSMDLFAPMNAVYSTFFGTSPPARACVAVDLPAPFRVKLDCVAFVEQATTDRQALHVQSLSYWAPANIGPYSQAITVDERIFISGQIGLIPSSLTLPSPRSLGLEAALASQHAARVVKALQTNTGGGWDGHAQAILYWLAHEADLPSVKKAHALLDNAPTLYLVVKDLPKNALVEKQVLYHTGRGIVVDEDGDSALVSRSAVVERGDVSNSSALAHWEVSRFDHIGASAAVIGGKDTGDLVQLFGQTRAIEQLRSTLDGTFSVRLFHKSAVSVPNLLEQFYRADEMPAVTPIPCRAISTQQNDDWDYALCIVST